MVSVARALAPTARIVAAAPTTHDAEELVAAGADRVIAVEMEAVVGLFDDVLRHYRVDADEILRHEETLRHGTYEAFDHEMMDTPAVRCELDADCFSTRTVTIRRGTRAAGHSLGDLRLDERLLHAVEVTRDGAVTTEPRGAFVLQAGDEVVFGGTAQSFVDAADLFRTSDAGTPSLPALPAMPTQRADWIDTAASVTLSADPAAGCTHLDHVHDVTPGTAGLPGVPGARRPLGPPAGVHGVRPRRLLRLVAEQARHGPFPRDRAPRRPEHRARRDVGLVLPRRGDAVAPAPPTDGPRRAGPEAGRGSAWGARR